MLEKPAIQDETITECLRGTYGIEIQQITFLPLGADRNTAVYRAVSDAEIPYFVKLRRGEFDETSVAIPDILSKQGNKYIIAPLSTHSGQLWAELSGFHLILYPFIEGQGGFDIDLSDDDWMIFGQALKGVHSATIPPAIASHIHREDYSPYWREIVQRFQQQIETEIFTEPVAAKLITFLRGKQHVVSYLVSRAEQLGAVLKSQPEAFVLCHSDIHAGNILIDNHNALYIVDWDQPIFAPKERDLMFVGGGLGGNGHTAEQEETLFYAGYGQTQINTVALAYYRYERIVQDIAAYCDQLLTTDEGGADREQGLHQLMSQFLPDQVIDLAYRTEKKLPVEFQFKLT